MNKGHPYSRTVIEKKIDNFCSLKEILLFVRVPFVILFIIRSREQLPNWTHFRLYLSIKRLTVVLGEYNAFRVRRNPKTGFLCFEYEVLMAITYTKNQSRIALCGKT